MSARLALALLALTPTLALGADWPQWRGPKNDGHSTEKGIPDKWSETENVVWKAKLPGPGASTPCIWGDKIFLTAVDGSDLVVLCIGTDGKEKWKKVLGAGNKAARGDEGNSASASCSTDGKLVYAFVGDGHLAAYDFDGNVKWTVDIQKDYGKFAIQFGAHWTPVLHKGKIYVTLFHRTIQDIVCFDAATGKELWKTRMGDVMQGETMTMAPLVVKGKVLVGNSGGELGVRGWMAALDARTGRIAWRAYSTGPDKDVLIGPQFKPFYSQDRGKDLGVSTWPADM